MLEPGDSLPPLDPPVINALADLAANRAARAVDAARNKAQHISAASFNDVDEPHATTDAASSDGLLRTSSKRRRLASGRSSNTPGEPPSSVGSRGGNKGLRHFSMKVCEKVESRGRTSYNEVADELVAELANGDDAGFEAAHYDEKNIRRRVYDAINVLMAMDIIGKEKKAVVWKGFPHAGGGKLAAPTAVELLRSEHGRLSHEAQKKLTYLQELIDKQRGLQYLLQRPKETFDRQCTKLYLPFILVQAKPDCEVVVKISDDMMDVHFDFINAPFQMHQDNYVLRQLVDSNSADAAATAAATAGGGTSAAATATVFAAGANGGVPLPQPTATAHAGGNDATCRPASTLLKEEPGVCTAVAQENGEEASCTPTATATIVDSPLSCVPNGCLVQSVRVQRTTRRNVKSPMAIKSPIANGAVSGLHTNAPGALPCSTPTGSGSGGGTEGFAQAQPQQYHHHHQQYQQQQPLVPSHVDTLPSGLLAGMANNPMLTGILREM